MPREFRRHGYQTHAIGKMHYAPARARLGFDDVELQSYYLHYLNGRQQAVETYDDYIPWLRMHAGHQAVADYFGNGVNPNSYVARPWDLDESLHPTTWTVTQAITWLYRRDPTAPFFLYLSFQRPHPPLDPPAWAFEQYLSAPYHDPPIGDWSELYAGARSDHRHNALAARMRPDTLHRARAGYYGNMAHVDMQFNRFVEALRGFGLVNDTYICVVSDHGDMFGDHHLFAKGFPYEGSARIPFLLAGPGTVGDVRRNELVELRDVMPTLLDCAGLPVPDSVEGQSVLPLVRGDAVTDWRHYLHGEHTLLGQSLQWITDDRYKYVWLSGTGREQLFDLKCDPHETKDLSAEHSASEQLARLRRTLIMELCNRPEGYVDGDSLVSGRPPLTVLPK